MGAKSGWEGCPGIQAIQLAPSGLEPMAGVLGRAMAAMQWQVAFAQHPPPWDWSGAGVSTLAWQGEGWSGC